MKYLSILLCTLVLSACSAGLATNLGDEPHVIAHSNGGKVTEFIGDRRKLEAWGGRVELRGLIASSAVIFTTLPNACIGKGASFGFHRSFGLPASAQIGNALIRQYFRNGVLEMYDKVWSQGGPDDRFIISAREYVRLDPETKICEEL